MSRLCHETCVKEVEGNIFLSNRITQSKMKCTALRSIEFLTKDIHVNTIVLTINNKIVSLCDNHFYATLKIEHRGMVVLNKKLVRVPIKSYFTHVMKFGTMAKGNVG